MSDQKNNNRGKAAPSVNPQGQSPDAIVTQPKSQLEERAKQKNTKI